MKKRRPLNADRSPLTTRRLALWPLFVVAGLCIISRVGYHAADVRFDASSLPWFWQFIDPALLKASIGLFPGHETLFFTACYMLLGLAFVVVLFLLLREFAVPDTLGVVMTAIYVVSPACVLYENWLFYTYPTTVLPLLVALFWHRFFHRGRFLDALTLFVCTALLAVTWSLFHLVWLLGLVLALALLRRKDWQKVLAAAAVPVLVVAFWCGKNLIQIGDFRSSTWFGINFSKMTNSMLTVPERRALYDNGSISAVSMVPPFSNPDRYYGAIPKPGAT